MKTSLNYAKNRHYCNFDLKDLLPHAFFAWITEPQATQYYEIGYRANIEWSNEYQVNENLKNVVFDQNWHFFLFLKIEELDGELQNWCNKLIYTHCTH